MKRLITTAISAIFIFSMSSSLTASNTDYSTSKNYITINDGIELDTFPYGVHIGSTGAQADRPTDVYSDCDDSSPATDTTDVNMGGGLFNDAFLYVNGSTDPVDVDSSCTEIPYLIMEKVALMTVPNADGSYTVMYEINVENIGGATGRYTVVDAPNYEDDITINSVALSTQAAIGGVIGAAGVTTIASPATAPTSSNSPWTLTQAAEQNIEPGELHQYKLAVTVTLDLTDGSGDDTYDSCGSGSGGPDGGEGLFNEATLSSNGDVIEMDTVCTDLPNLTLDKTLAAGSPVQTSANCYDVTYILTVENNGGATGDYDLVDSPNFDDDITINEVVYSTDIGGFTLLSVDESDPNLLLADDQSLAAGDTDTFTITYSICIDLD